MGILSSGRKFSCRQDKETKAVVCESFRENKDGTRQQLAGFKAEVGSDCRPTITESYEYEDGELDRLDKRISPRLHAKCQRGAEKPADY